MPNRTHCRSTFSTRTTKTIINFLSTILFTAISLEAKSYLAPGEKLGLGEFLVSENGQFRMGFNDHGVLEIRDIGKEPLSQHQRSYWFPRLLWDSSAYDYDKLKPGNYRTRFNLSGIDTNGYAAGAFTDNHLHQYTNERSLEIKKYQLFVRDNNNKVIWHSEPVPCSFQDPVYAPFTYADFVDEAYLYLENCGRAILITEERMLWCSCDYCFATFPLHKDHFASGHYLTDGTFQRIKKKTGGMLTHAEAEAYFHQQATQLATSDAPSRSPQGESKAGSGTGPGSAGAGARAVENKSSYPENAISIKYLKNILASCKAKAKETK
jgi:hypothetical protein